MLDHFISSIHHDNNSHAHSHINKAVVTNTITHLFFLLVCIPPSIIGPYSLHCLLVPNDIWLCYLVDPFVAKGNLCLMGNLGLLCRATGPLTLSHLHQPCSLFTLSESKRIPASQVFRIIATSVIKNGNDARLSKKQIQDIHAMCVSSSSKAILDRILGKSLFSNSLTLTPMIYRFLATQLSTPTQQHRIATKSISKACIVV
ncbi:predicted protein [Lichtheimia corymbifera JMRC:FSU:9682]|uniref:Uncharacterized protein n=1 Tax=Lichtheimia corymbifera JMRC:FSU:9682 TaxID=1263082 RepID=A0A068S916_9FUNG|nr:predicted protein [Lichtheimia corymbifera JMRC:FSU:9682]